MLKRRRCDPHIQGMLQVFKQLPAVRQTAGHQAPPTVITHSPCFGFTYPLIPATSEAARVLFHRCLCKAGAKHKMLPLLSTMQQKAARRQDAALTHQSWHALTSPQSQKDHEKKYFEWILGIKATTTVQV